MKAISFAVGLLLVAGTALADTTKAPDLFPVKMQAAPKHAPVELVRAGKPVGVVYVAAPQPSARLKLMLGELVETIKLRTGAELQVVTEGPPADKPAIIIGDCEEARKAGINAANLPIEGFVVKTAANRVYLVGSTKALPPGSDRYTFFSNEGTAWALSDFLERFVGVRWYWGTAQGGRTVEKAAHLAIQPVHYTDAPVFRKRVHSNSHGSISLETTFSRVPVGIPAVFKDVKSYDLRATLAGLREGNSWPYLVKCHEPQQFWHGYDQIVQQYPKLFSLNAEGKPAGRMLCYSSSDALRYILSPCEATWDQGKKASSWVTTQCLSISPGDAPIDCHCEACKKLYEPDAPQYGATRGEASRNVALFVKKACEEVKKRWPDKKVIYLPYWNYAHCPEDIEFPDNLEIEMATTGFANYRETDARKAIETELRQWSQKAGGKITTWEYTCWVICWTHAPIQFPYVAQEYYRENRDILEGSFLNGADLQEWTKNAPSLYVLTRLLWNPDIDVSATLDEMCRRLYGPGAATSRKLLQLMCDRWEKAPWTEKLGAAGHMPDTLFNETWPKEVVAEMEKLYRQARDEMKADPVALARFDYWNCTFEAFLKEAKLRRQVFDVPRLEKATIDGKADDWGTVGLRVDDLKSVAGAAAKTAGFEPSFRLAWDDKGLLVLAKVLAADFKEADDAKALDASAGLEYGPAIQSRHKQPDARGLDTGDCIELYLAPKVGESDSPRNPFPDLVNVIIAPGMDAKHGEIRTRILDMRQTAALRAVQPKAEVARTRIEGGYLLEARIAWDAVGVDAKPGAGAGFQFYAARRQNDGKLFHAVWYPRIVKFQWLGKTEATPFAMYPLRLVE